MRQILRRFANLVIDQLLANAEAVSGTLAPISKGAANCVSWADGVGSETCILKHFENTLDKNDHGAIEPKLKSISAVLALGVNLVASPCPKQQDLNHIKAATMSATTAATTQRTMQQQLLFGHGTRDRGNETRRAIAKTKTAGSANSKFMEQIGWCDTPHTRHYVCSVRRTSLLLPGNAVSL
jgi:hypothetical protein